MKLPKGWHEVTLKQLQDIRESYKISNPVEAWVWRLSALSGLSFEEIGNLDYFKETVPAIESLEWVHEEPKKLEKTFNIDGIDYVTIEGVKHLKGKQLIDLMNYAPEGRDLIGWAKLASVMCHPKGDNTYNADIQANRETLFWNKMPASVIIPMSGFFLTLYKESLINIRQSSEKKLRNHLLEIAANL